MRIDEITDIRNHSLFQKAKEFYLSNQKFIEENGTPIYRGMHEDNPLIFGNAVENRQPVDSSKLVNDYMIGLYKKIT